MIIINKPKKVMVNDTAHSGLRVIRCEYSGTPILMSGNIPLMTVTQADLKSVYEMLSCDNSDNEVKKMLDVITEWLDEH